MYPKITIGAVSVPTFSLCAATGIALLVITVLLKLRKCSDMAKECYYIIPKLCLALGFAYVGAILLDALFKIPQNGGFKIAGMTFYGGLITGGAVFYALVRIFRKNTQFTPEQWLNLVTVPFLLFHACGRIGCFMGGCCYGKVTNGIFGVAFPDQPEMDIYHNGQKVFPTQLYEAIGLFLLAATLMFVKKREFTVYVFAYPVMRFFIELLRGDNRGTYLLGLSPAQLISVVMLTGAITVALVRRIWQKSRI